MKRKFFAAFLSLCMVMSLVPMTALAATEDDGAGTPSTQAATKLPDAVDGVITLKEDVTLSTAYKVTEGNVIIDLAGHTLAYNGTGGVFLDVKGGSLTILDSGENGEVKVNETYNGTKNDENTQQIKCVKVCAGATFTLESGTITNTNTAFEATQVISNYGTTNIKGGIVKGVIPIFIFNPVRGEKEWTNYSATCNVSGGNIEGVAPTTYGGEEKYQGTFVKDLNWSYGIGIYGPGVGSGGTVDNNKSVLNITGGTITAGQAIGTNASSGRYAGYTINMSGGTVDGGSGTGMYLPAIGVTNISGGTVTAAQAIRICAGELNVTDGTITCTAVSDNSDLIAGGSGGTLGAIVVGKASNGYVGDIVVNVSGSAVVQNTADKTGSNDVYPTIVVSDKNMALASDQYIKDPATGNNTNETFKYSETSTSVTVNATIKGDIVKISNLTQSSTTQDGGKTSLDITGGTVTGDVINQTTEGDLGISGSNITGDVTNKSKGEVVISNNSKIDGTVSNTGTGDDKGSVAILDSTVTESIADADTNKITIVNSTVNGTATDNTGNNVAMIGATPYETLEKAIKAAQNGDTITLLKDIDNATGIAVDSGKNFTIDFNGKNYILTGPGAGSAGTATNGFQLLQNSTITFKNGTIKIDESNLSDTLPEGKKPIMRIIQNYANLTLEDMRIYAENQAGGEDYALSFNNGTILFKGNTSVFTTQENAIAFDVCKYASYPAVQVTFDEDYSGTIDGIILYDSSDADSHSLIIEGNNGTFGGIQKSATSASTPNITVHGGKFLSSVAQYVADALKYEANANGIYTYHKTLDEALAVSNNVSSVEAAKPGATVVTVTVKNGNDVDTIKLTSGTEYSLLDYPDQGYNHFQGWTDQNGKHYDGGETVTIQGNTTFTAVWSYTPPANPNYKITIGAMENGTVTANPTAAKAGATVTLTPVPDEGYALSTLTVTDRFGDAVRVTENSDGTYTFTMPNGQVTVTAIFVETEEPVAEPFVDVAEGDWFYDAVVYAYQNELMDGVGGNRFAPNSETTRAQLVTILYRLEGQPAVSGDLPFTDVEAGIWYTDAILWAAQNNIVNGVSDTEFAPGDEITRQQLVTILYRYAEAKGYDVSASADLSGYPDAGQVQDYAQPAMAWAVAENIIQGMEDGTLKPAGNASRAQIATILMRFCEDVAQ